MEREQVKHLAANLTADLGLLAQHNETTVITAEFQIDGNGGITVELGNASSSHRFEFSERRVKKLSKQKIDSQKQELSQQTGNPELDRNLTDWDTPDNIDAVKDKVRGSDRAEKSSDQNDGRVHPGDRFSNWSLL